MDIHEIRKSNLVSLIGKRRKGACAEKWGMSAAHLSQILSDKTSKNLGDDVARRIEAKEGLDRGWLDKLQAPNKNNNYHSPEERQIEARIDGPVEEWSDDSPVADDEVLLPFLKEVQLSAGSGRTAIEVTSNRSLKFGKYSLRNQGVQAENAVAVTVCGNSMEPVMPDGTTVAINRTDCRVVDGKTYAIDHGGLLRVKILYRLPAGGIRVRSHNRDEYPDEDYSLAQIEQQEMNIIGRVFWVGMYL